MNMERSTSEMFVCEAGKWEKYEESGSDMMKVLNGLVVLSKAWVDREELNHKYRELREQLPNPTRGDRTSIVGGAIEYIKEMTETVDELRVLVQKKRRRDETGVEDEDLMLK